MAAFVVTLLLLVGASGSGLAPLTPTPAGAAADAVTVGDLLDLLTYRIHTVRGTVDKTTNAVIGVPALVDVDRALIPVPDLVVEVVALPTGQAAVVVSALRANLPVRVELLFDLPGAQGVAFGYDATASRAPTLFTTALSFTRTGGQTTVTTGVDTVGAGATLGVITELFTRGQAGARVEPTAARLDLTPVPGHLGATITSAPGRTSAALQATAPTTAILNVVDNRAGRSRTVTGEARQIPTSATVDIVSDPDTGHAEAHYTASAPIAYVQATAIDTVGDVEHELDMMAENVPADIDLVVETEGTQQAHYLADAPLGLLTVASRQRTGGVVDREAVIEAQSLPRQIDVVRTGDAAAQFTADAPIGVLEGGFSSGGGVQFIEQDDAYVHLFTEGDHRSVAGRILGLQSVTAAAGDTIELSATRAPGPFRVLAVDDARTIDAVVADLPGTTTLTISPSTGTIEYHGDAAIELITADVVADAPFLARASHAHVEVRDVPTDLRLQVGPSATPFEPPAPRAVCEIAVDLDCDDEPPPPPPGGGDPPVTGFPDTSSDTTFVFDTNGAAIGRIDVVLDDTVATVDAPLEACDEDGTVAGPSTDLCEDGVLLEDDANGFALQGRITGLRLVAVRMRTIDERNLTGVRTNRNVAHFELDPAVNAGRPVRLGLVRQATATTTDRVNVAISNLPERATATIRSSERVGGPSAVSFVYDAAAPIESIDLNAHLSAMPNPFLATITDVPTHIEVCQAGDGRCHGAPVPARDAGSFRFDASGRVTLDAFLCLKPNTGTCDELDEADTFLKLTDVSVEHLAFELHQGAFTVDNPATVVFDTENKAVTGSIVFRILDKLRVDVNFPGEFLIAYTGPNVVGAWTGPLTADGFTLKVFNPPGALDIFDKTIEGSLGCDVIEFLEIPLPGLPNIDLKKFLCG